MITVKLKRPKNNTRACCLATKPLKLVAMDIYLFYKDKLQRYVFQISLHTAKKLFDIPVPSRDVTYQNIPGREL